MTEKTGWIDLPQLTPPLTAVQMTEVVSNHAESVAIAGSEGGPAIGWIDGMRVSNGGLQAHVRWLGPPATLSGLKIVRRAVDAQTGRSIGARLAEVIAGSMDATDFYQNLLSRHAADLNEIEPTTNRKPTPMTIDPETIMRQAATSVALKLHIPFEDALKKVRATAKKPLGDRVKARAKQAGPTASAIVPVMPLGSVANTVVAKAHLAKHLPGWDGMPLEVQEISALRLRDMLKTSTGRATLSKPPTNGKVTVVTALFAGASPFQRLQSYLASTTMNWESLSHDDRHQRTLLARKSLNIIDEAKVAA